MASRAECVGLSAAHAAFASPPWPLQRSSPQGAGCRETAPAWRGWRSRWRTSASAPRASTSWTARPCVGAWALQHASTIGGPGSGSPPGHKGDINIRTESRSSFTDVGFLTAYGDTRRGERLRCRYIFCDLIDVRLCFVFLLEVMVSVTSWVISEGD